MGDSPKRLQNSFKQMIRQQQWVASGENHIAHFGMLAQVGDGPVEFPFLEKTRLSDQSLASAEAAIDRALVGDHKQHAVRIPVHQMGHRAHQVFFEWIVFRIDIRQFGKVRDNLFPDRIPILLDGSQNGRRDPHGIRPHDRFDLFLIYPKPIGKIFGLDDAFGEYPSPFLHRVTPCSVVSDAV